MKKTQWGEFFSFVLRDLVKDGWRSFLTIANLMVFIACYFCLSALADAGKKFGAQPIDQSALMILSKGIFDPSDSQITEADFRPIETLIPAQVQSVSPLILRHMNIDGYMLQVRATFLQDFESVHSLSLISGTWPAQKNQVVIGEGTVNLTHWQIGRTIRIYGVDFTITGIVRAPGTKFASVWMTLENAESLFNTHGVYQFAWVVITPGANAEAVKAQIQANPAISDSFDVYFVDQLYQQYNNALSDVKSISLMMELLALLCVMLGAYGTTYLTLRERGRELAILRAVGFDSIQIRLILSARTLIEVMLAFVSAWGIAFIAVHIFQQTDPILIHSVPMPVSITWPAIVWGFLLCLFFALVGVLLPTRHLRSTSVANNITR
jgi:ABC-type antimicrobial peptide transport system permease subunit